MSFDTISGRTRPFIRKIASAMLGAALLAGASFSAHADPVLTFSFNLGVYGGTGTLNTNNYVPTFGTLDLTGGGLDGTYGLLLPIGGTINPGPDPYLDGSLDFSVITLSGASQSWSLTTTGDQQTVEARGPLQFSVVPEPASLALLGIGLVGIGLSRRRRA